MVSTIVCARMQRSVADPIWLNFTSPSSARCSPMVLKGKRAQTSFGASGSPSDARDHHFVKVSKRHSRASSAARLSGGACASAHSWKRTSQKCPIVLTVKSTPTKQ